MMNRQTFARSLLATAAVLVLCGPLASCGYSSKSLYSRAYRTISVPIFGNKTFRRDWEFRLTEAIDKQIEARTPYKLTSRDKAETILTGEIVDIQENVLTRRYGMNLPRETEVVVIVNFTWREAKTGRILVERRGFARAATELPQLGERVADAQQLAVERAAYAIVSQLEKDF